MDMSQEQVAWPDLALDDIGYLVKGTGTHLVHVIPMIFNWRVARTPRDDDLSGPDRAWCYYGTDAGVFVRAVLAAMAWDGGDATSPAGFDKDAMTGRYARPGIGQEAT